MEENYVKTQTIFLKDMEIKPCEGCGYCTEKKNCSIEDGMQNIYQQLRQSDVIILASPSYMGGVTSRTKIFMERTWFLRRGALGKVIGSSIIVGRREIGCCTSEINEYFDRMEFTKIPGVIGFGFEKGKVEEDLEAIKGTKRIARNILELGDPKTGVPYLQNPLINK